MMSISSLTGTTLCKFRTLALLPVLATVTCRALSCNVVPLFDITCPGQVLVGEADSVFIQLTNQEYTFNYEFALLDGAEISMVSGGESGIGTGTRFIAFTADSPGTVRFTVTEYDDQFMQIGNPLDCLSELVTELDSCLEEDTAGLGDPCQSDADCTECQVCISAESVPSNTCQPRIECNNGGDCLAASVAQNYQLVFCEEGICR